MAVLKDRDAWKKAKRIPHNAEWCLKHIEKANKAHNSVYRMSRKMYKAIRDNEEPNMPPMFVAKKNPFRRQLTYTQILDYVNQSFGLHKEVTEILIYE